MGRDLRGFTFVELMVVVAVAAILLAISVPSFQSLINAKRVEGIAAELGTDIQFARSEAVSKNAVSRIVFTSPTQYSIHTERPVPSTVNCTAVATTVPAKSVDLGSNSPVTFTGPSAGALPNCFAFEPVRGIVAAAASVEAVNSQGGAKVRISVGVTGRPQYCVPSGSTVGGYAPC